MVADANVDRVPEDARLCLQMLAAQLEVVKQQTLENDRHVLANVRRTELGHRLTVIPDVGPLLASAFVASVAESSYQCREAGDPELLRGGRKRKETSATSGASSTSICSTLIASMCDA